MQKVLFVIIATLILLAVQEKSLASFQDEKLLEETKLSVNTVYSEFEKKTAFDTILIEYVGDDSLSHRERSKLSNIVSVYSMKIKSLLLTQQSLKKRIEQYPGDDWDREFGDTGLWKNLNKSLINTTLLKLNIQYPKVLLLSRDLKEKLVLAQLKTILSLEKDNHSFSFTAYKAKLYSELSYSNRRFYEESIRLNRKVVSGLDSGSWLYFASSLELIKLGDKKAAPIEKVYGEFTNSKYVDSVLMNLKFALTAFLYCDNDNFADKILTSHPKVAPLFCEIVLKASESKRWRRLAKISTPDKFSPLSGDSISYAVLNSTSSDNLKLAKRIAQNRPNALTLYVQAHCVMEGASEFSTALKLLISASKMDSPRKWLGPDFSRDKLSRIACEYAFDKLRESSSLGDLALEALQNYQKNLGDRIDEELEYSLASLLLDSKPTQAQEILGDIAKRGGKFFAQAKFDLALYQLGTSSKSDQDRAIRNLKSLLKKTQNRKSYTEGLLLYSYLVLDKNLKDRYSDVLDCLDDSRLIYAPDVASAHAQVLLRLDRVEDAISGYSDFLEDDSKFDALTIRELVFALMQKYESIIASAEDSDNLVSCAKGLLSRVLEKEPSDCESALLLAELNMLANAEMPALSDCGNNSILALRCRAREMQLEHKYDEATSLWSDLSLSLKDKNQPQSKQSWQWWRAKYYQLYCYSLSSDFDSEKLKHAISVLLASGDKKENLWKYKMLELRNLTPDTK